MNYDNSYRMDTTNNNITELNNTFVKFIKTCEATKQVWYWASRVFKSRMTKFRVYVCMYVCVSNYSSKTTEPICIEIIPANRASYADCYRLLCFEIFTKFDELFSWERCTLHRRIFANGNVLRDVIVVISFTSRVFRNNPDWPTKKNRKTQTIRN